MDASGRMRVSPNSRSDKGRKWVPSGKDGNKKMEAIAGNEISAEVESVCE